MSSQRGPLLFSERFGHLGNAAILYQASSHRPVEEAFERGKISVDASRLEFLLDEAARQLEERLLVLEALRLASPNALDHCRELQDKIREKRKVLGQRLGRLAGYLPGLSRRELEWWTQPQAAFAPQIPLEPESPAQVRLRLNSIPPKSFEELFEVFGRLGQPPRARGDTSQRTRSSGPK